MILGGIFDVENKTLELKELTEKLSEPSIWDDPKTAQEVNKQKVYLERELNKFSVLAESISDSIELAEIAIEETDNLALEEIAKDISKNEIALHDLEDIRSNFPETLILGREMIAHGRTEEVLTQENLSRAHELCKAFNENADICSRITPSFF